MISNKISQVKKGEKAVQALQNKQLRGIIKLISI